MPYRTMTTDARWFDDDGRFLSVEKATMHAIIVQGGFTTKEIEAERMTRSADPRYREVGQRWLDANTG